MHIAWRNPVLGIRQKESGKLLHYP